MTKSPLHLPATLIEAVKSQTAILFLGAGASKEARNGKNETPPDAAQLRDILAKRFFATEMKNRDVMTVAEMAIGSSGGRSQVFECVRDAFDGFEPSDAHRSVATFSWRSIATTNYDLLLERAYSDVKHRVQSLVPFVKDDESIEAKLQASHRPVTYIKLHGCLNSIYDSDVPLILSREQYASYSKNRTRLFERLRYFARESTLIFVGYRLDDSHIRDLIYSIAEDKRPRWYIVTPGADTFDINFWAGKNVEVIPSRFGEFMTALEFEVPPLLRVLSKSVQDTAFSLRTFYSINTTETPILKDSFETDLMHIHPNVAALAQSARQFYSGYDTGWGAILQRLDVRRKAEDTLLYKTLLENDSPTGPLFLILRGSAGAGKTIALKRTAFEAASTGALVIWLQENGALRPDVFAELFQLTSVPVYLFVDRVALHTDKLYSLLKFAKNKSHPLVIVGAERESDWNSYCSALENEFHPTFVPVGKLSRGEIEGLLDLLARHNCLGLLSTKSREDQVDAFENAELADRQLLVILHELTLGKPFEDILLDEYLRISPETARALYLDIATMHQYAVRVRAGTIKRISGIDFEDFEKRFFDPLNKVVLVADPDQYTGDNSYKTRHPHVAKLVFNQVCSTDELKAAQYKRIIFGLDVAYMSDRRALEDMTRGRILAETFNSAVYVREIYQEAIQNAPTLSFLEQQWAIFESMHKNGSLIEAERIAASAALKEPQSRSIIHTQAEIDRKRANIEISDLLKDSLRQRARQRLDRLPSGDRLAMSSRCKILLDELTEMNAALIDDTRPHAVLTFAEKIDQTQGALARAQQAHPDDADIILVEARFRRLIDQEGRAVSALERAWRSKPKNTSIAIRLSKTYEARGDGPLAIKILDEALTRFHEDKATHQAFVDLYSSRQSYDDDTVERHLRKSFSVGDHKYEERFLLAQFLYLRGKTDEALKLFSEIDDKAPDGFRKAAPRTDNWITRRLPRYIGTVRAIKERFFFIKSPNYPTDIFGHRTSSDVDVVDNLDIGDEVNFAMRFNRAGASAVNVRPGRNR